MGNEVEELKEVEKFASAQNPSLRSKMIKTVGLETARKLKAEGFRQDTGFYWWSYKLHGKEHTSLYYAIPGQPKPPDAVVAPTSDEILEELPVGLLIEKISGGDGSFEEIGYILKFPKGHQCKNMPFQIEDTLPEALALCWIWLKSQGLLNEK